MIAAKFSDPDVAAANLEATVAATVLASLEREELSGPQAARFAAEMDRLSQDAFRAYRALVYDSPEFPAFFRQMTPVSEIATLKIGSRPASRTQSDRIEDLRAIPWVFSWSQARVMLPGWYGVGTTLAGSRRHRTIARDARRLAVLPDDARQHGDGPRQVRHVDRGALQRAGRGPRGRGKLFGQIRDEWQRTHDRLLEITGESSLLENNRKLENSIRLRLPYIEPLNHLQIELLRRFRGGETGPKVTDGIHLTINAIATALRNSG